MASSSSPARRAVVDAIAAYVGPTPYVEQMADRIFRLFESPPPVAHEDDAKEDTRIVNAIEARTLTIESMGTTVEYFNVYGPAEMRTTAGGHNAGKSLRQLIREAMGWDAPSASAELTKRRLFGFTVITDERVPENEIWLAPTPDHAQHLNDAVAAFNASFPSIPPEQARGCATKVSGSSATIGEGETKNG